MTLPKRNLSGNFYKVEMTGRRCAERGCRKYVYGMLDYCLNHKEGSLDFRAYTYMSNFLRQKTGTGRVLTSDVFYAMREIYKAQEAIEMNIEKVVAELDSGAMQEVVRETWQIVERVQSGAINLDQGHTELVGCKHILQAFALSLAREQFRKQVHYIGNGRRTQEAAQLS